MKLYHNPQCSKSREALQLLKDHEKDVIVHEYLKQPLSVQELRDVCTLLALRPVELLRTGEDVYKQLVATHGEPDDETALRWMHNNPRLMQRPILVTKKQAVIGRPPTNVLSLS